MKKFIEQIDAKMIKDSGLILLLGFTLYMLFKVLTNDLNHIGDFIKDGISVQRETNEALIKNAAAIQSNTEILRILERRFQ